MVCSNCQSNEIISIQDQQFCVNCGRLLAASEAKAEAKTKTVASKIEAKRGPGRPRSAKLDTPIPVKAAAASIAPRPTRMLDDIRPVQSGAVAMAKPVQKKKLVHHSVMAASLRALHPVWILLALPGALAVSGAATLVTWAFLHGTKVQQGHQLVIGLSVALAGVIWLRYIRSAVMFQRAGVHDHRLMETGVALRVTLARTGRLCVFSLRHSAVALVELGLLALVVGYAGQVTQLPSVMRVGIIFLLCFGLLYLLGSLWVVQRLVEAGIVVSDLSLRTAHWLGWRLWRRHWELLGARLGALFVIATLSGGLALGLQVATRSLSLMVQLGIVVGVVALGVAVLTVVSGGAAEASYRQLVTMDQAQRASRLLGRRHSVRPSAGAIVLLLAGLILPLAGALAAALAWH